MTSFGTDSRQPVDTLTQSTQTHEVHNALIMHHSQACNDKLGKRSYHMHSIATENYQLCVCKQRKHPDET